MAAARKTKLFKIASEINIGKDAIIEFLQSKGYDVQNKPTATLTSDMVEAVHDKFKKEIKAAEKQREKLQKHKDTRKTVQQSSQEEAGNDSGSADSMSAPTESVTPAEVHSDAPKENVKPTEAGNDIQPGMVIDLSAHDKSNDNKNSMKNKQPQSKGDSPKKTVDTQSQESKKSEDAVYSKSDNSRPNRPDNDQRTPRKNRDNYNRDTRNNQSNPAQDDNKQYKSDRPDRDSRPRRDDRGADNRPPRGDRDNRPRRDDRDADNRPPRGDRDSRPRRDDRGPDNRPPRGDRDNRPRRDDRDPDNRPPRGDRDSRPRRDDRGPDNRPPRGDRDNRPRRDDRGPDQNNDFENRPRKKRKNIIEVNPGDAPQLKGLTVLGKIEISPEDAENMGKGGKSRKVVKKKKVAPEAAKDKQPKVVKKSPPKKLRKTEIEKTISQEDDSPARKKRKKRKKSVRDMISQDDVNKAIKETLSEMDHSSSSANRAKIKQRRKAEREEKEAKIQEEMDKEANILELTEFVTTSDLANLIGIGVNEIIMKCMQLGLMVTINQRLDKDTIVLIADDYGYEVKFHDQKSLQFVDEEDHDDDEDLLPRSPIVTIMGHVDHGKTSLLDHIRSANVVAGEAGGITQHIGAYKVKLEDGRSVTFLDTPGHEAFTAMRARGAQVTDIVVLIVAADDSVMPQTIEAISHAKAANVPIVVAINKIDKPDAQPDRIRQQLSDYDVLVEDWGGKYQVAEISAKHGKNIDQLLEKILLEAEMLELKANPDRLSRGAVVEANMEKGLGATATIIVQKGTLRVGEPFVSGVYSGRVRALLDERGNKLEEAGPSDPVMVIGYDGLPEAGDSFITTHTDSEARSIANERKQLKREQELRQVRHMTLDEISAQISVGGIKDLNLVIKGDVSGSVEAISDSLLRLSTEEVRVNILHKGVGPVTENDVMLAAASHAIIIGFNSIPTGKARRVAETESVEIRDYSIIYDCINEVQLALEGLLSPEVHEEIVAEVEVRATFKISKVGVIAGCYVQSGKINRNDRIRVMRDGFEVFKGTIHSLKREKDDVREVDSKYECGIQLYGFNDIKEGDIIEAFKEVEVKRTL